MQHTLYLIYQNTLQIYKFKLLYFFSPLKYLLLSCMSLKDSLINEIVDRFLCTWSRINQKSKHDLILISIADVMLCYITDDSLYRWSPLIIDVASGLSLLFPLCFNTFFVRNSILLFILIIVHNIIYYFRF